MIDVKQLRIGSHIQFNGDMVRVYSLPLTRTESMPASDTIIKTVNDDCAIFGFATDFAPIPLTAELLQELGYEKEGTSKPGSIELRKGDITLSSLYTHTSWKLEIDSDEDYSIYILTTVKYLHELEQFVYFTIGKELVE